MAPQVLYDYIGPYNGHNLLRQRDDRTVICGNNGCEICGEKPDSQLPFREPCAHPAGRGHITKKIDLQTINFSAG